jgi:hypothetical protein
MISKYSSLNKIAIDAASMPDEDEIRKYDNYAYDANTYAKKLYTAAQGQGHNLQDPRVFNEYVEAPAKKYYDNLIATGGGGVIETSKNPLKQLGTWIANKTITQPAYHSTMERQRELEAVAPTQGVDISTPQAYNQIVERPAHAYQRAYLDTGAEVAGIAKDTVRDTAALAGLGALTGGTSLPASAGRMLATTARGAQVINKIKNLKSLSKPIALGNKAMEWHNRGGAIGKGVREFVGQNLLEQGFGKATGTYVPLFNNPMHNVGKAKLVGNVAMDLADNMTDKWNFKTNMKLPTQAGLEAGRKVYKDTIDQIKDVSFKNKLGLMLALAGGGALLL